MPQPDKRKLDTDDALPSIELDLIGGGKKSLPSEEWTLFLLYRGHW